MKAFRIQGGRKRNDVLYLKNESVNGLEFVRAERNAWGVTEEPLRLSRHMFDVCLRTGYLTEIDIAPDRDEVLPASEIEKAAELAV